MATAKLRPTCLLLCTQLDASASHSHHLPSMSFVPVLIMEF